MLHLLPPYQKRKVIHVYRLRYATVAICALSIIGISLIIGVLPSYVALQTEKSNLLRQKESYTATIESTARNEGEAVDISGAIFALSTSGETLRPLTLIDALSRISGQVRIDSYSFVGPASDKPVTVIISGVAKKRDELSTFAQSLNEKFGNVKLPLASLAKQSDIPFEFKFEMKQQAVDDILSATTTDITTTQ
jgi:hypothetical protein